MCLDADTPDYKKIEFFVAGLVPEIRGLVTANDCATLQGTIRLAHKLTNQKVEEGTLPPRGSVVKAPDCGSKRKWESSVKNSAPPQPQQQQKRSESSTPSSGQKTGSYHGSYPKCNKC